jgi:serine kinase of HPr protein (carbohydrate metabolism regulator)
MEVSVEELAEKLNLNCISGQKGLTRTVQGVYVSDLLSDVVKNARENDIWVTLHIHPNIIAVAVLKNISAIIIVNERYPEPETIEASEKEGIPVLLTSEPAFDIVGKLYQIFSK